MHGGMDLKTYYLAVDIGASSGRHMLSWMEGGEIRLEEIYRFENRMVKKNGHLCWDSQRLFDEIVNGLNVCKQLGKIPVSMAIDTWAVDFALLDEEGRLLGDVAAYRDHRTDGMDQIVSGQINQEELYKRTGIQKQIFNTIYQLTAIKLQEPKLLEQAESLLLMPDYFNYLLTGVRMAEYTNATTTQLVNPMTRDWDEELIRRLGLKKSLFLPITMAGTSVGHLRKGIQEKVGFDLKVVQAASHDTASAVLSVPARTRDFLYISSGTWSLMGVERMQADCSKEALEANFTNEGGYGYRYRFLKNIMGMWMIQSVRHELHDRYSFAKLCEMAEECDDFPSRVDVNDNLFLSPESMTEAIVKYCRATKQRTPKTPGEFAAVIYHSLAESYGQTANEIEKLTGIHYDGIHIVGGGANAEYLNRLTARVAGKTVYSGPTEATALGNAIVQMIKNGEFQSLEEAREAVYRSFPIKCFKM